MRIVAVEVENFGVFGGVHRFSLVDPRRQGHLPRALIVGHNGSGKSTLFHGVALALYGPAALRFRANRHTYHEHLGSLIHRGAHDSPPGCSAWTRVAIDLERVRYGASETLRLERRWRRHGGSVEETAAANRLATDGALGKPLEEQAVAELFPPDLQKTMLVDAALLHELTAALHSRGALDRILRELSGLRLVERLRGDLLIVGTQIRRERPHQADAAALCRLNERAGAVNEALEEKRRVVEQHQTDIGDIERSIAEKERELMAVGGSLEAHRPALRERLVATETELEQAVADLRDLCAGTLPFALCPNLCIALDDRLDREALASGAESIVAFADTWLAELCAGLVHDGGFRGLIPEPEMRRAVSEHIRDRAMRSLTERVQPGGHAPVHDLSERDRVAIRTWTAEAVGTIPARVAALEARLDRLENTRNSILEELERVPDEDGLQAVQQGLRALRERLIDKNAELVRAQDLLDSMEAERLDLMQQISQLEEALADSAKGDRAMELIHGARLALGDFEHEQLQRRAKDFGDTLVDIFNGLSRKRTLLAASNFDVAAGELTLLDGDGRSLDTSELSMGELQLYSLAMLESLRVVTGVDYPLLVDTPLAHLDEQHREALLSGVLFGGHSQVVLFATDKEMDTRDLERWWPDIDCAYFLAFDSAAQSSLSTNLTSAVLPVQRSQGQVA